MKINLTKVKPTYRYKVIELANVLGITKQAIYKKIKYKDLPICSINDVIYVYGEEFREFEKQERAKRKPKKQAGKFWCLHCKSYQDLFHGEVSLEYFKNSGKNTNPDSLLLIGHCLACKNKIYQFSHISKLNEIEKRYKIV